MSSLGTMNATGLKKLVSSASSPSTVAVYSGNYQNFNAYRWSASGFGTQFSAPATIIPDAGYQTSFNPAGTAVGVGINSSPFCYVYAFSASTGFGTKYANPSVLPSGTTYGVGFAFSKDGSTVSIGTDVTPFINAYAWSNGFGTKYANPTTVPSGSINSIKFNSSSTLLATANAGGSCVYPWSVSGFGTKYTAPANYPANGADICFSPDSTSFCVGSGSGGTSANRIYAYPWNNGYGTRYSNPTLPTGNTYCGGVTFSTTGGALLFNTDNTTTSSNALVAFGWVSGTGFGTRYSSPSQPPIRSYGKLNMDASGKYVGRAMDGSTSPPYSSAEAYGWSDSTGFGTYYRAPSGGGNGSGFSFN
jgi:hypothetical protein